MTCPCGSIEPYTESLVFPIRLLASDEATLEVGRIYHAWDPSDDGCVHLYEADLALVPATGDRWEYLVPISHVPWKPPEVNV